MIKKLNKNRIWTDRPLGKWYFDKETTDYLRISMQLLDIKMELRDLKNRVWIHVLRLRFAIANTKSFETKTQLKFKEKIVLEHVANIEKLREENKDAWRKNLKNEYLLIDNFVGSELLIDYYNIYCVKKNNFDYKDALPSYAGHTI